MLKRLQENSDLKHDALENDLEMIFQSLWENQRCSILIDNMIILNQTHISSE